MQHDVLSAAYTPPTRRAPFVRRVGGWVRAHRHQGELPLRVRQCTRGTHSPSYRRFLPADLPASSVLSYAIRSRSLARRALSARAATRPGASIGLHRRPTPSACSVGLLHRPALATRGFVEHFDLLLVAGERSHEQRHCIQPLRRLEPITCVRALAPSFGARCASNKHAGGAPIPTWSMMSFSEQPDRRARSSIITNRSTLSRHATASPSAPPDGLARSH